MKIKAAVTYDLNQSKFATPIFVIIRQAIILIGAILTMRHLGIETRSFGGTDSSNVLFIFVFTLAVFKDQLFANTQFGRSRETAVVALLVNIIIMAFTLAFVDLVISWVYSWVFNGAFFPNFRSLFYSSYFGNLTFGVSLLNMLWNWFYLAFIGSLACLIAIINYKLPKKFRLLVWLGIPVLFIIITTRLAFMEGGIQNLSNFYSSIIKMFGLPNIFNGEVSGKVGMIFITGTGLFALNSLISLWLIKNTPIKE